MLIFWIWQWYILIAQESFDASFFYFEFEVDRFFSGIAGPCSDQRPWCAFFCENTPAGIMLKQTEIEIFGMTDIKPVEF